MIERVLKRFFPFVVFCQIFSACTAFNKLTGTSKPLSDSIKQDPAAAVSNVLNEALSNPETAAAVQAEIHAAMLSDVTQAEDTSAPQLSRIDQDYARMGKNMGLVKNLESAEATAFEIGNLAKGILGGESIQFSDKEEFRCKATTVDAKGFFEELLLSKAVYKEVALLRIRGSDSPVQADVQNHIVQRSANDGFVIYTSESPEIWLAVQVNQDLKGDDEISARLQLGTGALMKQQEFSCVHGPE